MIITVYQNIVFKLYLRLLLEDQNALLWEKLPVLQWAVLPVIWSYSCSKMGISSYVKVFLHIPS